MMTVDSLEEQIVELMPALRAFSRTFYKNQNDAEDLVQETLVKALTSAHHFDRGTRLKSWLFTIMRNAFCTRFRHAQRESPGSEECVSGRGTIEPAQEWVVLAREMEEVSMRLPHHYRAVLQFVVVDGGSYEEAAERFGCPVGTIKSRVNRARRQLIEDLGSLDA